MSGRAAKVELGFVTAPSGSIVVLDPGYLHDGLWCGDREPRDPKGRAEAADFAIEGKDAEAAGRAYDRQWHPRYLFDSAPDTARAHFDPFVVERKLDARLRRLEPRVSHRARVDLAIEHGRGGGELMFNGLWAAAAGGLPRDRKLPVVGVPMEEEEFEGRWRFIDLEVEPRLEVARSAPAGLVMVDYGLLMFADGDALSAWNHESLDGRADFVFWGPDAAEVGRKLGARELGEDRFGWKDLALDVVGRHAAEVQRHVKQKRLRVGVDFRPHSHGHHLMERLRASAEDAATLELGGAELCGFANRWGDGLFEVVRELDARDRLVRVRIDAGNEKRKALLRKVAEGKSGPPSPR
jgi:hypothetical protein